MERERHRIISITELERIINIVFNNRDEVLLCYLYGSYVSGNRSEFSDIDLGILLDSTFKKHYLYQVDLSLEIEKEFGNKIEIDLCGKRPSPRCLTYCENAEFGLLNKMISYSLGSNPMMTSSKYRSAPPAT